jgi:hypothetical protein
MAHFAKVINGIVVDVNVAEQEWVDVQPDKENWIQTSYNTYGGVHYDPKTRQPDGGVPLRKNYAGIGFRYDSERDAFIPPQPYPSWILDEETCLWMAPVPLPGDKKLLPILGGNHKEEYEWNEEIKNWTIVEKDI